MYTDNLEPCIKKYIVNYFDEKKWFSRVNILKFATKLMKREISLCNYLLVSNKNKYLSSLFPDTQVEIDHLEIYLLQEKLSQCIPNRNSFQR